MKVTIDYDTTTFLNAREKLILKLLISGKNLDQLSDEFGLTELRIRQLIGKIDKKLGIGIDNIQGEEF